MLFWRSELLPSCKATIAKEGVIPTLQKISEYARKIQKKANHFANIVTGSNLCDSVSRI